MSVDNTNQWSVRGEFAEACNCSAPCQCLYGEAPDDDECTGALFWHVEEGEYDGAELDGLTVGVLLYDEGILFEGDWRVVFLLDDRADEAQAAALEAVFTGQAGGVMGAVAELVGDVRAVETVPIAYSRDEDHVSIAAGEVAAVEADLIEGFGEVPGEVSPHPVTAPSMAVTTGKSATATVSYDEEFSWDVSGNNAFLGEFEYEGE
ncbi:DUF1326 domain-containing protein [Halalkalicoccus jeotgali]|uniref:DUF1326 domain-containing protein n=1 Tax=Halalkalicoccus jeotgali (strain DSM 18796 / CECT 7217 / JCM 14584 / KCTC 4019 / B3) TaxID=795797 RepID=D8JA98_HALJB|nr:DUF1326 domain-containing protein [Halalkalicoccus jeotgali]ADJ14620.1 hypothetical protein HacjB3_06145 [Halalkalicoccus jeotgali B3]ELY39993.1 hypothetical protein C497_04532 [Halalkalicoccus jeotgali B3]